MSVRSPTAGTWSSSQWRPDNEFETDRFNSSARTPQLGVQPRRSGSDVRPGIARPGAESQPGHGHPPGFTLDIRYIFATLWDGEYMTKYPLRAAYGRGTRQPRACWWRHGRWRGERAVSRLCWMASRTWQARQPGLSLRPVAPAAGRRRLDRGHARTRDRPTVRTEAVKGELDGGISSAAGGPVHVVPRPART